MDRDWRADRIAEREMGDIALTIERFLRVPPFRCSAKTRHHLQEAADALREDCQRVTEVWN
jgi:hypothetical protein